MKKPPKYPCPKCAWEFKRGQVVSAMCGLCGKRNFLQGWVWPVPYSEMFK